MSNPQNTQAFIRQYDPSRDNLEQIFAQVHEGHYPFKSTWWASYWTFCLSYLHLAPETCFVVDSGQGSVVGFLVGTPDTKAFATAWKRDFLPTIADELSALPAIPESRAFPAQDKARYYQQFLAWKSVVKSYDEVITQGLERLLEKYPAHYHIGLSPEYRKLGLGRKLVERFCTKLKGQGCPGIHLTVPEPEGNEGFHRLVGFTRSDLELDGESGELGVNAGEGHLGKRVVFVRELV